MKSFVIKTNKNKIINYLLKKLENSSFENIFFISKEFKCYKNVIVHYLGVNINEFLGFLSDLITETILIYYEPVLLRKFINFNYFYFDNVEKEIIEQNCYKYIILEENKTLKYRRDEIFNSVIHYIYENKSIILEGFVNFRLANYMTTLNEIVDYSANEYVIDKEYNEFISLLKIYVKSKASTVQMVHLVYTNGESILLDEEKNVIDLKDNVFNAKYLSDISFSSNDFALNALLTLLPKSLEIHIVLGFEDEFINTLKLIFGNRVSICTDCNICRTYKILNNVNKKI